MTDAKSVACDADQSGRLLERSEELLRDVVDALPVLISYVDADQRYQFVNKPYEAWFQRPMDQIIGHSLQELMPEAAYEMRKPFIERVLAGETVKYEGDMPQPNGVVTTEVLYIPHRDESGDVVGFYALVLDITERNQAEEALRQSEIRFRRFAEQNPAMIWSCDRSGLLNYLSSRWYEFTGQNPDTPLTTTWDDVVHPDDRPALHARWAEAMSNNEVYDLEARLLRYDGEYRWHSIRAEPMLRRDGKILGWLGTNSDIDETVREREERKRDHDRLWRISQELMVVRDLSGTILSVNPSVTRVLGWQPEEIIGRSIYEFLHPDDTPSTRKTVSAQLSGSGIISVQNRYRCRDGGYRTLDWRGVLYEGHVHSVARDVTNEMLASAELHKAEEALRQAQKMEAVGRLTGGIAHDFNNMLAGIIGSLNILQRRIDTGRMDDVPRFAEAALASAHRAAALTQRLLAFGRRQALDIKPVDIAELVSSLSELLRRTLGPSILLSVELSDDLWFAEIDPNQLESAILNLAINARDAMPDGGTLTIGGRNVPVGRFSASERGKLTTVEYVELSIRDTGFGMPEDVIEKVFEPFFTTKPVGQGTGLGLSMVHGFVSQIGGDVRIESEVGKGTTVQLLLPRARKEAPEEAAEAAAEVPAGAGQTVLVVEDDETVRTLVMDVLHEHGYIGIGLGDASAALPLLRGPAKIGMMISDIGLPTMSGRQLAEIAREVRPDLPILFITGYAGGATNREELLSPGMAMLTKPFKLDDLAMKISDMLARAKDGERSG
jgi:PAS domain S-box-containing protein